MAHGFSLSGTDADERAARDPDLFTEEEIRKTQVAAEIAETLAQCERDEHARRRRIIVSRHPAAIEFVRQTPEFTDAPVMASATAADLIGAVVAGNLPLCLAAQAAEVVAVEFYGPAPRGTEYSMADMVAARAHLARYRVLPHG